MTTIEELRRNIKAYERMLDENCFPEDSEEFEVTKNSLDEAERRLYKELLSMHRLNPKTGKPCDIIDSYMADYVIENYNIMVFEKPYIYENGVYKFDKNGLRIKEIIGGLMFQKLKTHIRINRVYQLLIEDIRIQVSLADINNYPNYWINFKNGMLDVKTGKMHPHSPKYKSVNQIPHNYIEGLNIEDSVFHKFLLSRIPDEENRRMLYEYMGYCLLPDIIFQKFMILVGVGNAGKSVILSHLEKIIGSENVSAVPLQSLSARFTSAFLLNKQCNICADLSNNAINDTSVIKQLTGEDLVQAEYKGGDIFFFRNRAKFFFSCNDLPMILDERSNGFYRRLLIIRFRDEGEYIENLHSQLKQEEEIEILISYLVSRGKNALTRGKIYESGENLGEVSHYQQESDTVTAFLDECTQKNENSRETRPNLFSTYTDFCKQEERQPLGKTAFFKALETKGFRRIRIHGYDYFDGIEIKWSHSDNVPFNN